MSSITISRVNWEEYQTPLQEIRAAVFIDEQQVPVELEWDGEDEQAYHWLATTDSGEAIGTLRMLRDGHIGRMAVLKHYRQQGVGRQLLDAALQFAEQDQLFEVYLYAQTQAQAFYSKAGFDTEGVEFMDANMPHITMRKHLFEQRQLGIHGGKFAINDLKAEAINLIEQTDRSLRILSYDLNHKLFSDNDVVSAISTLARRGRFSDIRILIVNERRLRTQRHQLIDLHRRLSTAIKIRVHSGDISDIADNIFIADNIACIVQSIEQPEKIWGNMNNKPIAQDLTEQFDLLWAQAIESKNIRPVNI